MLTCQLVAETQLRKCSADVPTHDDDDDDDGGTLSPLLLADPTTTTTRLSDTPDTGHDDYDDDDGTPNCDVPTDDGDDDDVALCLP